MTKNSWKKLGVVGAALIILMGYVAYIKYKETHFPVDPETFDVKDSLDEVMEAEFAYWGELRLADEHDLLQDVDIRFDTPDLDREIQVHKVWFVPDKLFVLYSMDLLKEDESGEDVPELSFSGGVMEGSGNINIPFEISDYGSGHYPKSNPKGEVFDRRLYRSLVFTPDFLGSEEITDWFVPDFEQDLLHINKITLDEASLQDGGEDHQSEKEERPIDGLSIKTDYKRDEQELFTVPLDQEVTLESGHTIHFQELQANTFGNELHYTVEPDDQIIRHMGIEISWYGKELGKNLFLDNVYQNQDGYTSLFSSVFEEMPDKLLVTVNYIGYVQKEDVSFEVPANLEKTDGSEELWEYEGLHFYFKGYEEVGDDPELVGLKLKWEMKEVVDNPTPIFGNPVSEHDLNDVENEDDSEGMTQVTSSIIRIENENGDTPGSEDSATGDLGMNIEESGDAVTIYLNKDFVEQSEELRVIIKHFPFLNMFPPPEDVYIPVGE